MAPLGDAPRWLVRCPPRRDPLPHSHSGRWGQAARRDSGRVSRGPANDPIVVDLPAGLLSTHDYEVALDASYVLTVTRR
jgi:hypothetical protein